MRPRVNVNKQLNKRGNYHGLDNPDPRRNLHRPRNQWLPPGRVLVDFFPSLIISLNGTFYRDRARFRGRGWFSAMELPMSRVSARLGGRPTGEGARASEPRRFGRRGTVDYAERNA